MKWKKLGYDLKILHTVLEQFLPRQRREWYVKIKMCERGGINFSDLAEGVTQSWYMAAMVCGGYLLKKREWPEAKWINSNLSPIAVDCIQERLIVNLLPFLNPTEIKRYFTAYPDRITPQYAERLIKKNKKRG